MMAELTTQESLAAPATEPLEALVDRAKRNKRGYSCRNDRFLALVEELERLRGMTRWIPVTERLPEPGQDIDFIAVGPRDEDKPRLYNGWYSFRIRVCLATEKVTHWRARALPQEVRDDTD